MPLYDVYCETCQCSWETLARWNEDIHCPCGEVARRLISAPVIRADIEPYYDDGLGVRVTSRAHRRQVMREKDLVENDRPIKPHGARGTVFSFPGQAATSVPASGAYASGQGN